MRTFTFAPEVDEALRTGRRSHPDPKSRVKYDVLWLKHRGLRAGGMLKFFVEAGRQPDEGGRRRGGTGHKR